MVYVAILGHGVVGSGVAEVLLQNADSIAGKAGDGIAVKRVLDLREFPDSPIADRFTKNFEEIVNDGEIRIVVETMGGLHPAYDYVKASLLAGKSVVTSNKELVAAKGDELLKIARDKDVNFLFEASVGGGIPILRPLDQCLAANKVCEIAGILNGTTNFMLTKMFEENMGFDEALALAQKLGYAEKDPTADVGGHDTCRKICILASLAFGKHVYPEQIRTEGITAITKQDVAAASAFGGVIKLIGLVRRLDSDKLHCAVSPMLIGNDCLLSGVKDVFNGILVRGDVIGDVMFYGRGAGKLPTASAVVADVIDEVKRPKNRHSMFWESGVQGYIADPGKAENAYLVRLAAADAEKLPAVWPGAAVRAVGGEAAVITPPLDADGLNTGLASIGAKPLSVIPVFDVC